MGRFRRFLLLFLACFSFVYLVHAQSQQGFISIDCGSNSSYTEPITGLNYVSDVSFVDTGTATSIPVNDMQNTLQKQLWSLRSFPQGKRNCYNVKVKLDTKYLIRASFFYANYDGQNSIPEFNLHFGPNFWTTVELKLVKNIVHQEIIHVTTSDLAQVCLINTGSGTPFISALELRPLAKTSYITVSGSLATFSRLDIGGSNTSTRYPDDVYDRTWRSPDPFPQWTSTNTSLPVGNQDARGYIAPSRVLSTASTVVNASASMDFFWSDPDQSNQFYVYMYFAEIQKLQTNESRIFKIHCNDKLWYKDFSPEYLLEYYVYSTSPLTINATYNFKLIMSQDSTLPPILNGIEIYKVMNFSQSTTNEDDVDAIESIKKTYGITKNWEGDPCAPKDLSWQGLNCSYDSDSLGITGLNLSYSALIGEITANISKLERIEVLDLSNNNLSGVVPDFLAAMRLLRVLNLSGNNLSGEIPAALTDKKNKGFLSFSFDGNPNLYLAAPSGKKKKNVVIPIVAAVGAVLIISIVFLAIVFFIWKKQNPIGAATLQEPHSPQNSHSGSQPLEPFESPSRQYSYSDILRFTNSFSRMLGKGGFGKVYHGRIGNIEVAVKMLTPESAQGYREFQTEVDLLLRVHHRNLTSLIGYCNEGETKMGLVYEYMSRGSLGSILSDKKGEVLRWEERLRIAVDSAQGLEYLHNGCRPPFIHRDIKSSNILLNEYFEAKLADFGLSRAFPTDSGATHVTTKVVGTPGYLDPEYYTSYRLTEKSDIYSFGIVLLELITGRPVLVKTDERSHIVQWARFHINQGDIHAIVDSKIKESCNTNSVWKAVDIARSCTAHDSANRPTMSQIVNELKECLNLELNQRESNQVDSAVSISSTFYSEIGPVAR